MVEMNIASIIPAIYPTILDTHQPTPTDTDV